MIYFTSDLHFGHDREFIYGPRGFETVHKMDAAIIKNFNEILTWEDELYILGDCMLNNNASGILSLKLIPGKKHIILGNHDTTTRRELYEDIYYTDVLGYSIMFKYDKFHALLSHYPTMTGNYDDSKKHCVWNISGHTHSKDKFQYWPQLIYNVAVDAHDCKPVSIEQIINDIKEKYNNNNIKGVLQ